MKKTIVTVFLIIGVLVISLLVWRLVFAEGGVLQQGWNGLSGQVNQVWKRITGQDQDLMPEWTATGADANVKSGDDNMEKEVGN